jgi:MATE family multidrug resistance protein
MSLSHTLKSYQSELKATVTLGLPIIIGQLGLVLMGVADTMQVGKLGAAPIAAATFVNSTFWLVSILGVGSMMVISPQTATARTQLNYRECRRLLDTGLILGLGWGVFIAIVFGFLASHFQWFKPMPEVLALGPAYAYIIALSAIPMLLFTALRQFTDGLSFTRVTMIITIGGLLLNVFLNWVLIYGKLGAPAWGLNGAGVATLISRIAMAAGLAFYIFKDAIFRPFTRVSYSEPLRPLVVKIVRLGLPGGLQLFFEIGAFNSAVVFAGWLGTLQQAAHGIAINMASVTYMVSAGLSSAGAIRVGQAVGMRSRTGIVRAGTMAIVMIGAFMGLTCLLFLSLSVPLTHLYTSETELVTMTASLVIIAGFFQLSDGLQVAGLGVLRGIADVNVPTYITLVAYWVIGLPVAYLFAFPLGLDIQGVWYGLFLGLTVSAFLLLMRFYKLTSRPDFEFKEVPAEVLH